MRHDSGVAESTRQVGEVDRPLAALLDQQTAAVAGAILNGDNEVGGIPLTDRLRQRLALELESATGDGAWRREHLRDHRPLFEFLQTQRLIAAQRRALRCRFSSRS